MATTATPFALPYPQPGDTADVPYWVQALAERLHAVLATQDNTALNYEALNEGLADRLDATVPAAVAAALAANPTLLAAALAAVDDAIAADTTLIRGEALDAFSGWNWALMYADREVAFGQRTDGTYYPAALGGTVVTPGPVVMWGDSLTSGWASSTSYLTTATGAAVSAYGVGGQDSTGIAARQGGAPTRVTVAGDVIPASGSVTVTTTVSLGTGTHSGVLQGVAGTLSAGTFTRTTAGLAISCPPGSPFQTGHPHRDSWPIFWAGRNNFQNSTERAALLADVAAMMAWTNRRDRALILSIPPWSGESVGGIYASTRVALDTANDQLRAAWPGHYLDLAAMLRRTTTLEAVGITPTATDLTNITDQITPASFRESGDAGHWNAAAYQAAALLIGMTYTSKGWTS